MLRFSFITILFFQLLGTTFFGEEKQPQEDKCPHGCCQRYRDYEIRDIQNILKSCFYDLVSKSNYIEKFILNSEACYHCGEASYYLDGNKNDYLFISVEVDKKSDYGDMTIYDPADCEINFHNTEKNIKINGKPYALENYPQFIEFISLFRDGLVQTTESIISKYKDRIFTNKQDLEKCRNDEDYAFNFWFKKLCSSIFTSSYSLAKIEEHLLDNIERDKEFLTELETNLRKKIEVIDQTEDKIQKKYDHIFTWCLEHHNFSGALYNQGFYNFHLGNNFNALQSIKKYIEHGEKLSSDVYKLKGDLHSELGLYNEAIIALTKAIELNPKNKDAYFTRAECYFELGNFDVSLQDFLKSKYKSKHINLKDANTLAYVKGLIAGAMKGSAEGFTEFVPSALGSIYGLGHGLWSFIANPPEFSIQLVKACQSCINYLKENPTFETLSKLVPELKDLILDWDNLEDSKRGEIFGFVIGKYGIDIFMSSGALKAVRVYRELKKANNLFTLEKLAASPENSEKILAQASKRYLHREEVLKNANLKIQWDKQGKHIKNHINFREGRSIFEHANPERLIKDFAGKGFKENKFIPGSPGYKEVVDFREFIGYDISETGEKTATTWGTIHYAKDGVHIVPTYPRE